MTSLVHLHDLWNDLLKSFEEKLSNVYKELEETHLREKENIKIYKKKLEETFLLEEHDLRNENAKLLSVHEEKLNEIHKEFQDFLAQQKISFQKGLETYHKSLILLVQQQEENVRSSSENFQNFVKNLGHILEEKKTVFMGDIELFRHSLTFLWEERNSLQKKLASEFSSTEEYLVGIKANASKIVQESVDRLIQEQFQKLLESTLQNVFSGNRTLVQEIFQQALRVVAQEFQEK